MGYLSQSKIMAIKLRMRKEGHVACMGAEQCIPSLFSLKCGRKRSLGKPWHRLKSAWTEFIYLRLECSGVFI
jgi:hypothetical protein